MIFKKNIMKTESHRQKLINSHQILVLSSGFEPLYKTNWKRALSAIVCGRAEIIETHKTLWLSTSSGKMKLPTIVRFLSGFVASRLYKVRYKQRPTKRSLWARDDGQCQYCQKRLNYSSSTIDHVRPQSRGGDHSWSNLVIACVKCNQIKGNSLPLECKMFPIKLPRSPGEFLRVIH